MALRWRIRALIAVFLLVLAGTGATVQVALAGSAAQTRALAQRLQPGSELARTMLSDLVDQETGERGFIITGDRRFLAPYTTGRAAAAVADRQLETLFTGHPQVLGALRQLETAVATWRAQGPDRELAAASRGQLALADRLIADGRGKAAFDHVRTDAAALQSVIGAERRQAEARVATAAGGLRTRFEVSVGLLLVLVLVSWLLLRRWVLMPVQALRASMRRVAGGQLWSPVHASGPAEVAAIGLDAEAMRLRVLAELEAARTAQEALAQQGPVVLGLREHLAPSAWPEGFPGLTISGALHPAEGVLAGDWWEAIVRPDGSTVVLLADVSGHGAGAGLVAVQLKHTITALLAAGLDLLTAFTQAAGAMSELERFFTCLLVELEPGTGRLRWVNAGHPPALLVSRGEAGVPLVRRLEPTGPLASGVTSGWAIAQTVLEPGELLFAYTDGLTEARRDNQQEFGVAGILEVLERLADWEPARVVDACLAQVRAFADNWRRDDITCLALTRTAQRRPAF